MRRLLIIFYWMFYARNNVKADELLRFLIKPKVKSLGKKLIHTIDETEKYFVVEFTAINHKLYWPKECAIDGIYQVACETFESSDWHYYQKAHTHVLPNDVVLDIGAAEGLFALSVIDHCGKVIMIEPNDFFYRALEESFSRFKHKIEIHNVAVGNHEGEILFDETSLSGHVGSNNTGSGTSKKITKVDTLLRDEEKIDYLKADLEGFELEMLKGAAEIIKKHKPKIAITSYHRQNVSDEITSYIKSIVPEYKFYKKGVFHEKGKPVMIHFWIE